MKVLNDENPSETFKYRVWWTLIPEGDPDERLSPMTPRRSANPATIKDADECYVIEAPNVVWAAHNAVDDLADRNGMLLMDVDEVHTDVANVHTKLDARFYDDENSCERHWEVCAWDYWGELED